MKQLDHTTEIINAIRRVAGEDVDTAKLAVFETIALNSKPFKGASGIYNGAVPGRSFLRQMAEMANGDKNGIHLHTMHQEGYELPVGRVFAAELNDADGVTELRTLFYIDKSTAKGMDLIAAIDSSTIDEVSVGVLPKSATCAECGFDFMGEEADIMNLITATCSDGHEMGVDSFVRLSNLDLWMELSLVSRGAADGAKILQRSRAIFGSPATQQQLAASATHQRDASLSTHSLLLSHMDISNEEPTMKVSAEKLAQMIRSATLASFSANATNDMLLAAAVDSYEGFELADGVDAKAVAHETLEKVSAELKAFDADVKLADKVQNGGDQASLSILVEKTAQLQIANGKIEDLTVQLAAAKNSSDAKLALEFMVAQATKALAASGSKDEAPTTIQGCIDAITNAQVNLAALPTGGASRAADHQSDEAPQSNAGFITRK